MKTLVQVISLLSALNAWTTIQAAVRFPARLTCTALGDCTAGHPNFCQADGYFPEPAVIINPAQYSLEPPYDPSEKMSEQELQAKVQLDFSDGDQYEGYLFDAGAMDQLAKGELQKIPGTYEDGFYWIDGYNTRARFKVECWVD